MQRGYSRAHRPDCKQVVIALIVNPEGFPLGYETFDGKRAEVTAVEAVMRMVERKYGRARRIWVFDRGIVSEENLVAFPGYALWVTQNALLELLDIHLPQRLDLDFECSVNSARR